MNIQTVTYNNLSFLVVQTPQELEVKQLCQEYKFDKQHLEDYVDRRQVAKIEIEKDYALIVLDFPYIDPPLETPEEKKANGKKDEGATQKITTAATNLVKLPLTTNGVKKRRIRTGHVNFYIGRDYLVVLHDDKTPQINALFTECQKNLRNREHFMGNGSTYLFYRIVDALIESEFTAVKEITQRIDEIDQHLIEERAPNVVEDISIARRNVVVLQTIVKPTLTVFNDLSFKKYEMFDTSLVSWSTILDYLKKIWDRLEDDRELIEGISTSHESLLTARTNEIVKVLTMFTAIILPVTLLASVYGMNIVGLPYAENGNALIIITLIMVIMGLIMVIAFKFKNWL